VESRIKYWRHLGGPLSASPGIAQRGEDHLLNREMRDHVTWRGLVDDQTIGTGAGFLTKCAKDIYSLRVGVDISHTILTVNKDNYDYGIAADGKVASVCIFSHVPLEEIETLYLDYQSKTSVRLAQLLLETYWKKEVVYKPAAENFMEHINCKNAAVIIGDRALKQLPNFKYIYDLAEAWKDLTGLPFVFAAWITNKKLPEDFISSFNEANAEGLKHIDKVVAENSFPYFDLKIYYTEQIHYLLDERKKEGLNLFLKMLGE